ncbi:MAG: PIG-L deacetylase family protein [Terriglobia bacterium]
MDNPSRRNFLKDLGLGTATFSMAAEPAQASQLPGAPPSGDVSPQGSRPSSIMAIAAHPGDAFFAMGAAVAMQVHLGGQGVFLSLSLGERGSAKIAPAEYGLLQRQSAERAAEMLGARAEFLTYPDGEVPQSEEARLKVCDLIRAHKVDVVVTHWRGSWHKDHQACYQVANDAVFYAGLPALVRQQPAHAVKKVFYNDNWEDADGFATDTYLDITPVFDRWIEACAVFPMWRGENGFRYNDYYRSLAIGRGCLAGSQYAVALMSSPDQLVRHVHAL